MSYKIINDNCLNVLSTKTLPFFDLTFLDPPFNQGKEYSCYDDNIDEKEYWKMMNEICKLIFNFTNNGGAIYFMQREKNAEFVMNCLRNAGFSFQNLIIWKKKTSAVPVNGKFGKHYQIIVYATKGERAKTFNRLRIEPPLPPNYKFQRENGIFLTDVWDDIRELTSGYFAGDEAIRTENGERFHKQQAPIALLLRIILCSSRVNDMIFDPFAGTGTTLVVAKQLQRNSIGIEIDSKNTNFIQQRLDNFRDSDIIEKYFKEYSCTENISEIWGEFFETENKIF